MIPDYEDVLKTYSQLTPFSEMEEIKIKAKKCKNNSKKPIKKKKKQVYNNKCKKEIEF